ncbi:uncharacterized protein LOC119361496 [Triticum dicoccoides]|uniref:uncharacterized protein LOC119361496 n=1 Tax=Triticum dicoccoides TaxID=85692 RepID=UPI0018908C37|nr:uncharacterized protein LOC119361496 [Triticum dicoccoides]
MDQGSSSGTGDEASSKLQLKAYIEQQEGHTAHCIPVMVSITAPSGKLHSPVDLVVVLNVQDKQMKRQKLLVDAVKVVIDKLDGEADSRLAIVCDRSTVLPMTTGNRVKLAPEAVTVHYKKLGYTSTSMVRALATAEKVNTRIYPSIYQFC